MSRKPKVTPVYLDGERVYCWRVDGDGRITHCRMTLHLGHTFAEIYGGEGGADLNEWMYAIRHSCADEWQNTGRSADATFPGLIEGSVATWPEALALALKRAEETRVALEDDLLEIEERLDRLKTIAADPDWNPNAPEVNHGTP